MWDVTRSQSYRKACRAESDRHLGVPEVSTRSWISEVDTVWGVSASRTNDMATRPDDV